MRKFLVVGLNSIYQLLKNIWDGTDHSVPCRNKCRIHGRLYKLATRPHNVLSHKLNSLFITANITLQPIHHGVVTLGFSLLTRDATLDRLQR